jgi:hypothetical protein
MKTFKYDVGEVPALTLEQVKVEMLCNIANELAELNEKIKWFQNNKVI